MALTDPSSCNVGRNLLLFLPIILKTCSSAALLCGIHKTVRATDAEVGNPCGIHKTVRATDAEVGNLCGIHKPVRATDAEVGNPCGIHKTVRATDAKGESLAEITPYNIYANARFSF